MSLSRVPGQARAKRFLMRLLQSGHVPHALLFSGTAGIGKATVAVEFAKRLNCLDPRGMDSCDDCSSCRKAAADHHPDLLWVKREGAYIKLDKIRELKDRLKYRPFEGLWRVVIIHDAQDLKEEAGNSLLKILEEPPRQNLFILTVTESQKLLPTIVSRCCHLRFQPLEDQWVEKVLQESLGLSLEKSREVAQLAEGSLDRARWLTEENRVARWQDLMGSLQKLGELPMIDFFALTAQWSQKNDQLEQDLESVKLWIRDLLLSRLLIEYHSVFPLDARTLDAARGIPIETLFQLYDRTDQAVQNLRLNANKQLTLESVCLAIKDGLYGKGHRYPVSEGRQNLSF